MSPIEWTNITRAVGLGPGDLAYLPDVDMSLVLVGTINEFTVAVMMGADVSKCMTRSVDELTEAAFAINGFQFEGDVSSLAKLDAMDDPYEALVVCGKEVLLVARPPSHAGYVTIKVGELEQGNFSKVAFAYRNWRILKNYGSGVIVLYEKH